MADELKYKIIPRDPDDPTIETADWDEAVDEARFYGADTIQEWLDGRHTADLDIPPAGDVEQVSKLTVRTTSAQEEWINDLCTATGLDKSQLTRVGLALVAAVVLRPPMPPKRNVGNPNLLKSGGPSIERLAYVWMREIVQGRAEYLLDLKGLLRADDAGLSD